MGSRYDIGMRSHRAALGVLLAASACAGPRYSGLLIPAMGAEERCRVGAGRSNPLVTEWLSSVRRG